MQYRRIRISWRKNTMQDVCDHKFHSFGISSREARLQSHIDPSGMPEHELRLGRNIFLIGAAVSGLMLLTIKTFGLYA